MGTIRLRVKVRTEIAGEQAPGATYGPRQTLTQSLLNGTGKRLRQQGYPDPGASVSQIVAFLKLGSAQGLDVRPWDASLELPGLNPSSRAGEQLDAGEQPTKRSRTGSAPGARQSSDSRAGQGASVAASGPGTLHGSGLQAVCAASLTGAKVPIPPLPCDEVHHAPGTSSSENATTSGFNHQNPSPAEVQTAGPMTAPSGVAPAAAGAAGVRVSDSRAAAGTCMQAAGGGLLPLSLLRLQGSSETVLGGASEDLSPASMAVCLRGSLMHASHITDAMVDDLLAQAKVCKRKGDRYNGEWSALAISHYVESCLMFMEACECMLRIARSPERVGRASTVLLQTAELLSFTVRTCETGRGPELPREIMRVLCERLAATCYMKEAACMQNRYHEYSQRISHLLTVSRSSLTQQAQPQQPATGASQQGKAGGKAAVGKPGADGKAGNTTSPNDSTTSSQDHLVVAQSGGTGAPGAGRRGGVVGAPAARDVDVTKELGGLHGKLCSTAKNILRFADLVRRTTNGFQALVEKPDMRAPGTPRVLCMHMAAVCMDFGMADGGELLGHAHKVLECVRQMVAASL